MTSIRTLAELTVLSIQLANLHGLMRRALPWLLSMEMTACHLDVMHNIFTAAS